MIQPTKLLLDECLGKPLIAEIQKKISGENPAPIIHHLTDYFTKGVDDLSWISALQNQGWTILTADRGKKSNQRKLPQICLEFKITHILMGSSILHIKQREKVEAIVSVWKEIKACGNAPIGSRFTLQMAPGCKPVIKRVIL